MNNEERIETLRAVFDDIYHIAYSQEEVPLKQKLEDIAALSRYQEMTPISTDMNKRYRREFKLNEVMKKIAKKREMDI